MARAAKAADLDGFIESLPDGYDTWVGERGVTLSGGQRQRLAIARIVLIDPPLLILDDSTSSVDVGTEYRIQQALAELAESRTTFVIAHRLSTVRNADLILVLDRGEIVERGTHRELMERGGMYRRIHDLELSPQESVLGGETRLIGAESWMADQGGTDMDDRDQVGQVVLDEGRRHQGLGAARAMGRLFGYVGSGWAALLVVLLALLAYTATLVAIPWMVKLVVDGYVAGSEVDLSEMTPLILALGAVILVHYVADSFYHRRVVLLGQEALFRLRVDLFDHMMRLPMAFYDRNQVGRVMSRVQNDVQQLQELLNVSVFSLASVVSLAAVAGAMVVMDPRLGSVTLLSLLLVVPLVAVWQRWARLPFLRARETVADVNSKLQEGLSAVRVVQSLNRERANIVDFDEANRRNLDANLSSTRFSVALEPSVETMSAFGLALVVLLGGAMVLRGSLEVGVLVAFAMYLQRFFDPLERLTREYGQIQKTMASISRIFEILDIEPSLVEKPGAKTLSEVRGAVRFDGVSFGYGRDAPVLQDVDLDIRAGETVALVGPTGAGKTTLVSLLLRFYDVGEGRITLDGHDLRGVTLDSLAAQTGVVLQEPYLFSGTIRENIRYSSVRATDAEIERAARAVGAHGFISKLGDGYDTMVRQRGGNLSVGQRQLVSLARALVADPRILILDEATANIDTYSEMLIQRALDELMRDRTSVVIAHRLSTVRNADRIAVVDGGRIVEQGYHDELLELGGLYARLHSYSAQEAAP